MHAQRTTSRRSAFKRTLVKPRGMTFVDALVILMLLITCVGILGCFGSKSKQELQAQSKETRIKLREVATHLELYKQNHSSELPEDLNALLGGDFNELPKDGWGQDFIYRKFNDKEHELFSKGPDAKEGTEDDIRSRWSR